MVHLIWISVNDAENGEKNWSKQKRHKKVFETEIKCQWKMAFWEDGKSRGIINKMCVFMINDWICHKMHKILFFVLFYFQEIRRGKIFYVDFKIYCFSIPFCIRHHQFSFHFRQRSCTWERNGKKKKKYCVGVPRMSWKLKPFIINYQSLCLSDGLTL